MTASDPQPTTASIQHLSVVGVGRRSSTVTADARDDRPHTISPQERHDLMGPDLVRSDHCVTSAPSLRCSGTIDSPTLNSLALHPHTNPSSSAGMTMSWPVSIIAGATVHSYPCAGMPPVGPTQSVMRATLIDDNVTYPEHRVTGHCEVPAGVTHTRTLHKGSQGQP